MSDYLFVYGTLNPDRAPPDVRSAVLQLRPLTEGTMSGRLYDFGDFPGAIFDSASSSRVRGRILEIPNDEGLLQSLDIYEEFNPQDAANSLFIRERHPITLDNGNQLSCWVYLYNRALDNAPAIPGGNYFAWSAQSHSGPPHASLGH